MKEATQRVEETIHTINGYNVDPKGFGLFTRHKGYEIKVKKRETDGG